MGTFECQCQILLRPLTQRSPTWQLRRLAITREQTREEGFRNTKTDGGRPSTDGALPTSTDPQQRGMGKSKRARDNARSTGNTKWRERWATMTGAGSTTRVASNPTTKDCHNKRHQHIITPRNHTMATKTRRQQAGQSNNPNMTTGPNRAETLT